jgi:light-regulated signal transduction histidine kinase (bacteriophytochrome)
MANDSSTSLQGIQSELQASEARFDNLVSNSPDGILIVDSDAVVRFANPAAEALFDRAGSRIIGSPFGFPVFADDTVELDIVQKNGDVVVVEMRVVNTNWEGERALLTALRDVTAHRREEAERKRLVKELRRSNAEFEQFTQIVAHDLHAPLQTIVAFCEFVQDEQELSEESVEHIATIIGAAQRMKLQITDLMAYCRVQDEDQPRKLVDSKSICDEAISNLLGAITESAAVVTQSGLPTLPADRALLIQLFQNLIGNAIKFCADKSPTVAIACEQKSNEWLFSVKDNGIGIDPKRATEVFDIFRRLHSQSEYQGTGIGLAICKKIVECHGGRIWVESTPEQGSTFFFTMQQ